MTEIEGKESFLSEQPSTEQKESFLSNNDQSMTSDNQGSTQQRKKK
jgi:hypothetical protein